MLAPPLAISLWTILIIVLIVLLVMAVLGRSRL
jgi:Sec-independent protein translocase protein TatA